MTEAFVSMFPTSNRSEMYVASSIQSEVLVDVTDLNNKRELLMLTNVNFFNERKFPVLAMDLETMTFENIFWGTAYLTKKVQGQTYGQTFSFKKRMYARTPWQKSKLAKFLAESSKDREVFSRFNLDRLQCFERDVVFCMEHTEETATYKCKVFPLGFQGGDEDRLVCYAHGYAEGKKAPLGALGVIQKGQPFFSQHFHVFRDQMFRPNLDREIDNLKYQLFAEPLKHDLSDFFRFNKIMFSERSFNMSQNRKNLPAITREEIRAHNSDTARTQYHLEEYVRLRDKGQAVEAVEQVHAAVAYARRYYEKALEFQKRVIPESTLEQEMKSLEDAAFQV